jgi:hypothetical protein
MHIQWDCDFHTPGSVNRTFAQYRVIFGQGYVIVGGKDGLDVFGFA